MTSGSRVLSKSGITILGATLAGIGLFLGGCNNKLKAENEQLRNEMAAINERVTAAEAEKQATASTISAKDAEIARLSALAAQSQQQQPVVSNPMPAPGPVNTPPRDFSPSDGGRHTSKIEISSDVLFTSGSATLRPEARRELDRYLTRLRNARAITIEGHTDSDPIRKSKWGSNQALSKARADAVRDYIVGRGVSRGKIDTVGKGSSEPKGSKKDSRRVDIMIAE